METNNQVNPIYCYAPFYHSHVDSVSANRLCCIAKNDLIEKEFQDNLALPPITFWNSDYIKNRRRMMIQNQSPPECYYCRHPNSNQPYKEVFKENFEKQFQLDQHKRSEDLTVNYLPFSVDYRTAICNLKCIMCYSGSSTSINAQYKKRSEAINSQYNSAHYLHYENLLENSERTFDALETIIEGGNLKYVYFAGGEPTMTKDHLGLLDRIYKHKADSISLTYNTNLMQSSVFTKAWKAKLERFEDVSLFCSIDAVGDIGEYLRDGLKISQFEKNLKILTEDPDSKIKVSLDATVSSLSLFNAVELSKFAIQHNVSLRGRLVVESMHIKFMLVNFLPQDLRKKIVQQFENFFKTLKPKEQQLISEFRLCLQRLEQEPDFDKDTLRLAASNIEYYKVVYPDKPSYGDIINQYIRALAQS